MKLNRTTWIVFAFVFIAATLYRVWDGRPLGFAPQIAIAIFAGAVIKDKKWAILVPLLSMFLSDLLYQALFIMDLSIMPGFYEGQLLNYILFTSMIVFGMMIRKINVLNIAAASLAAPTVYFILSNFIVWIGGGGYHRPKTWDGLAMCFNDALPFYRGSLVATVVFSVIFFGAWYFVQKTQVEKAHELA